MSEAAKLPQIARLKPYYAELQKGRSYYWCACGLSRNQPFCDGSHQGSGIESVRYTAEEEAQEVLFCACKRTAKVPFCDGAHNNLSGAYELDDPDSERNRGIDLITAGGDGMARLDGGCYVLTPVKITCSQRAGLRFAPVISAASGGRYQSQYYFEQDSTEPTVVHFADSHVILFVSSGSGTLNISGQSFGVGLHCGVYVRPGEAFAMIPDAGQILSVFASACPLPVEPEFPGANPTGFDHNHPERVIGIDQDQRTGMGDRYFQVLIDATMGCEVAAQFIGEIPPSKAAPHCHLYEESLIVLSGEGMMWTESHKAAVAAGDIIFLPPKQKHSLQCTSSERMLLAGVISPGNNPSINY